jgi:hypothetical protein
VSFVAAGSPPRFSLRVALPTTPAATLFVRPSVSLRLAPTLLFATSGCLLRLGLSPLPLRLRLTPLLPAASALLFATPRALLFATSSTLPFATSRALLFADPRPLRPFVAPAPRFGAFGALLGMSSAATLPAGFRVGAGDRGVRQGERTADGDRAALSASVS